MCDNKTVKRIKDGINDQKIIELEEYRAMVMLPKDAVEIQIKATIYKDNKLSYVSKTLDNKEIQKAFTDAQHNYIEDDDEFVFTEKGLSMLAGSQE